MVRCSYRNSTATIRYIADLGDGEEVSLALTKVFEQLALVAALPADTSLLRPHHFPGSQIHSPFFGSVLEENSIAEEQRHRLSEAGNATA